MKKFYSIMIALATMTLMSCGGENKTNSQTETNAEESAATTVEAVEEAVAPEERRTCRCSYWRQCKSKTRKFWFSVLYCSGTEIYRYEA